MVVAGAQDAHALQRAEIPPRKVLNALTKLTKLLQTSSVMAVQRRNREDMSAPNSRRIEVTAEFTTEPGRTSWVDPVLEVPKRRLQPLGPAIHHVDSSAPERR